MLIFSRKKKHDPFWVVLFSLTIGLRYCADAAPATCKTICVPLSSFTVLSAELITEPCALPAAAVLSARPCSPTTPRLVVLSVALAAPPTVLLTAPVAEPAVRPTAPTVDPTAGLTAPVAEPRAPPPRAPPPMDG